MISGSSDTIFRTGCLFVLALVTALISGCGSGGRTMGQLLSNPPAAGQTSSYSGTSSPLVSGGNSGGVWTFTVDHQTNSFSYTAISYPANTSSGTPAGTFANSHGFLNLTQTNIPTSRFTGYSLEIPGRLALLRPSNGGAAGSNANPLVIMPAQQNCINISGVATFQFVTLPTSTWAVNTAAAFGSVQAITNGNTWSFPNLQEFTVVGASTNPPVMPMGTCGPTQEGNVITIPAQGTTPPNDAATTIIIGPSGFFVEDLSTGNNSARGYPGLVGVIQPSAPLDTNAVQGGNYLGFRFEPNLSVKTQPVAFAPATAPAVGLAGGVYPPTVVGQDNNLNNPPLTDTNINLGAQDPANNGLYKSATITIPGSAACGGTGGRCVLPAVAVVGNPENKFAIFLIAQNSASNSPIGIYLLQQ